MKYGNVTPTAIPGMIIRNPSSYPKTIPAIHKDGADSRRAAGNNAKEANIAAASSKGLKFTASHLISGFTFCKRDRDQDDNGSKV